MQRFALQNSVSAGQRRFHRLHFTSMFDLTERVPGVITLQAVVGSHAYGLATSSSDVDRIAVWISPTEDLLGLRRPQETIVGRDPDFAAHEVGIKFAPLALAANPTILEVLWLDTYEVLGDEGKMLVDNRDAFLSKRCNATYRGYAQQQMKRLQERGNFQSKMRKRRDKHARHCARLLEQLETIKRTGKLSVRVQDPEEIFRVGQLPNDELIDWFAKRDKEIGEMDDNLLPDKPDTERINEILLEIRRRHYPPLRDAGV